MTISLRQYQVRPVIALIALSMVMWSTGLRLGGLQLANVYLQRYAVDTQTVRPIITVAAKRPSDSSTANAVNGATNQPAPSALAQNEAKSCNRDTSYQLPTSLSLDGRPSGLTTQTDQTSYYQVHGSSSPQVSAQMASCAPSLSSSSQRAEFASETGYNLGWQYAYQVGDTGQCTLTNVKVGLRINMVLPSWTADTAAQNGFVPTWQRFISSLTTHENGHVAIDEQYAAQLLTDLQNYPPSDCATIASNVKLVLQADVARLNQANDQYDATTNHGAAQGAIL